MIYSLRDAWQYFDEHDSAQVAQLFRDLLQITFQLRDALHRRKWPVVHHLNQQFLPSQITETVASQRARPEGRDDRR
jgi:hypothetical protein